MVGITEGGPIGVVRWETQKKEMAPASWTKAKREPVAGAAGKRRKERKRVPPTSRPLGGSRLNACPCPDALRPANEPLHTQSVHHVGREHHWFRKLRCFGAHL